MRPSTMMEPALQKPQPIIVVDLFSPLLDALIELLASLRAHEWERPTACPSWSVKDVAQHLLGDDVVKLASGRDDHAARLPAQSWEDLVAAVNEWNESWVRATRRVSPQLLVDLLAFTGTQVCAYFRSLDPYAMGDPVSWAGPDPAPVWLDLAREYTERWHHQQHIRDQVGRPGLKEPRFLRPVLDTFVRALPHSLREADTVDGTLVALTISGAAGGQWCLRKEREGWILFVGAPPQPHAEVIVEEDVAWRVFTRTLSRSEAREKASIVGDQSLGLTVLDTVAIIA